jgi:putative ABC transport system permease protein
MFRNSLKIFFRSISKNKIITFINITGLVLGITSTMLILEYVVYERSFEAFHKDAANVYRVVYNRYRGETLLWKTANSFFPTGPYMKSSFPEVRNYFNLARNYNIEVSAINPAGDKTSFFEEKAYYLSASAFEILTLPLVKGTKECLSAPNTVALSEKAVKKYFGNEDPLGKIITVNNHDKYTITGVYKDIQSNTHIRSDLFFSFATILNSSPQLLSNWMYDNCHTYLQLAEGTDYKDFERKAFLQMKNDNYRELLARNNEQDIYFLQPIKSIHLNSAIEYETEPPGNGRGVSILFGFSIFFLIIAWINYINLVTARSVERAEEIGIKKVFGTENRLLIFQFISEAFVFNAICLGISIILILLLNPLFKQITGIDKLNLVFNIKFWLAATATFISGVLISSIYPAVVLSSFKPLQIIKGQYKNSQGGLLFRKVMVTFQLFVSLSLLIGTVIVYEQVQFLMKKDPGFQYSSTIVLKAPRTNEEQSVYQNKILLFRKALEQNPEIAGFTFVSDIPGYEMNNWFSCYRKGFDKSTENAYFRTDIDYEFLDFFKVRLLAGRNFTKDDKEVQLKTIINLKALKRLGFDSPEDAVGQLIMSYPDRECEIIGVIDDFNYYSAKVEAVPTVFTVRDSRKLYVVIKYMGDGNIVQRLIKKISPDYNRIFPGSAFEYILLEDKMASDIKPDRTFALVFGIFSVLAIIIGIIGILGLIIITINQNVKALVVRKILGADQHNINILLGRQLWWELIISVCIAVPVSYYSFKNWVLDAYIYRVSINWEHLLFPVLSIVVILLIVILTLARAVISMNPAEVLRTE